MMSPVHHSTAAVSNLIAASTSLQNLTGLSEDEFDRQMLDHVVSIRQLLSTEASISLANDETVLDYLVPSHHSLAHLLVLHLQVQVLQEKSGQTLPTDLLPRGRLWSRATFFLRNFDPAQVRYVGHEWRQLVELICKAAQAAAKPFPAARLVRDAMLRLDPTCTVFTSIHLLLVQLCLQAKAYSCALPILEKQICHISSPDSVNCSESSPALCAEHDTGLALIINTSGLSSKVSYKDYLMYFLYGGMVLMALKEWRKALHFLGIVISIPTAGSVSLIMVEAYKKWILVGLLERGKLPSLPSITAPHVSKIYQSLAKPYIDLGYAFESGDGKRLQDEAHTAQGIWHADNNMGLVAQVVKAFPAYTLLKIRKVFAALTVTEASDEVPLLPITCTAAESTVAPLIMSYAIDATMVHSARNNETMLRFANPCFAQLSHELDIWAQLEGEAYSLRKLMNSLKLNIYDLGLSDKFVDSIQGNQQGASATSTSNAIKEHMGLEMDEDLMGDLS